MCAAAYFLALAWQTRTARATAVDDFFLAQAFPVMATAFTNHPDSTDLLRFPLDYRSYFLVRMAAGIFRFGHYPWQLWLFGLLVGPRIFMKPALLPWALLVLLAFAAFNLLFIAGWSSPGLSAGSHSAAPARS